MFPLLPSVLSTAAEPRVARRRSDAATQQRAACLGRAEARHLENGQMIRANQAFKVDVGRRGAAFNPEDGTCSITR
jgi:hypothetical protein